MSKRTGRYIEIDDNTPPLASSARKTDYVDSDEVIATPIDDDEWLYFEPSEDQHNKDELKALGKLIQWLLLILVLIIAAEALSILISAFGFSQFLGSAVAIGYGALFAMGYKRYRSWRSIGSRFDQAKACQAAALEATSTRSITAKKQFYGELTKTCHNPELHKQLESAYRALPEHTDSRELVHYLDQKLYRKIDTRIELYLANEAKKLGLAVAMSPIAILDIALIWQRTNKMINFVAYQYGTQPSLSVKYAISKEVLTAMLFSAGSELAIDQLLPDFSQSLLTKFSARAAQGMSLGILYSRIGVSVARSIRPVGSESNAPQLSNIAKNLLKSKDEFEKL